MLMFINIGLMSFFFPVSIKECSENYASTLIKKEDKILTSLITGKLKLLPLEILSKMYNKRMIFSYSEYSLSLSLSLYIYIYIHIHIYIYMYMVSKLNWGLGQKYLKAEVFLWVTIVSNFCATQD